MKKFKIRDTWVYFPFVPYPPQEVFMSKMLESLQDGKNALLESPTGTGKTLCLLCGSLAWLDEIRKFEEFQLTLQSSISVYKQEPIMSRGYRRHTIIFSSRTHSQLMQAIGEFQNTSYGHMRAAVLGARKHLCLHPSALKDPDKLDNKCRALRETPKPKNKCEGPAPDIEELPRKCSSCNKDHQCPYYKNFLDMEKSDGLKPFTHCGALNQLRLKEKCAEYKVCPFYVSRHLAKKADILFIPYSYVFNPHILRGMQLDLRDAVLIVDEGHNIENICEDNASFEMKASDFKKCCEELRTVKQHVDDEYFPEDVSEADIRDLEKVSSKLYASLQNIPTGSALDGQYLLQLFLDNDFTYANHHHFEDVMTKIIQFCGASSEKELKVDGLKKVKEVALTLFYLEQNGKDEHSSILKESFTLFKEDVKPEDLIKIEPKIFFWCFDAGIIMKSLQKKGIHSFIVTSGTLSPLSPLKSSLSIPFDVELINRHVVDRSQILSFSINHVCKSAESSVPEKILLNSSYRNREHNAEEYYIGLGHLVLEVAKVVPKGLLLFFHSSKVKQDCLYLWSNYSEIFSGKTMSLFDAINIQKRIFEEPKLAFELPDLQIKFSAVIDDEGSNGACLIGVMSGKVSEGIDFKDDYGRTVIMAGFQFPPIRDSWVVHKREAVERKLGEIAKEEWYLSAGTRPVNQALGRIIRHRSDYGAIILADERFCKDSWDSYKRLKSLPEWVSKGLKQINFEELQPTLKNFFLSIPLEMDSVALRAAKEQAEVCHRHREELRREERPSEDFEDLKQMKKEEEVKKIKLRDDFDQLRETLQRIKANIYNLSREVIDMKSSMINREQEIEEPPCDSDAESIGDSDWAVIEALK